MSLNDKESEATSALLGLQMIKDAEEGAEGETPSSAKRQRRDQSTGTRWSREEDESLRAGIEALGPRDWKRISEEYLGGKRKDIQCYQRWERTLKPGVKTGPWTKEEDKILKKCMEEGMTKWSEIAKRIPGRLSKRVRERWTCQLNPDRKEKEKCPWTENEENILFEAQQKLGHKWVEIAKLLPGRTENDVKNRAYCEIRKKQRQESKPPVVKKKERKSRGGKRRVMDPKTDLESMAVITTMYQAAMDEEAKEEEEAGKGGGEGEGPSELELVQQTEEKEGVEEERHDAASSSSPPFLEEEEEERASPVNDHHHHNNNNNTETSNSNHHATVVHPSLLLPPPPPSEPTPTFSTAAVPSNQAFGFHPPLPLPPSPPTSSTDANQAFGFHPPLPLPLAPLSPNPTTTFTTITAAGPVDNGHSNYNTQTSSSGNNHAYGFQPPPTLPPTPPSSSTVAAARPVVNYYSNNTSSSSNNNNNNNNNNTEIYSSSEPAYGFHPPLPLLTPLSFDPPPTASPPTAEAPSTLPPSDPTTTFSPSVGTAAVEAFSSSSLPYIEIEEGNR